MTKSVAEQIRDEDAHSRRCDQARKAARARWANSPRCHVCGGRLRRAGNLWQCTGRDGLGCGLFAVIPDRGEVEP